MTDEELLQLAAGGDQSAFLRLYQRHRDGVYRFAYRMIGFAGAEDVAHQGRRSAMIARLLILVFTLLCCRTRDSMAGLLQYRIQRR